MGKNYLFTIAISNYLHTCNSPLPNAKSDVERLKAILTQSYSFDHIEDLLNETATRKNIIESLSRLEYLMDPEDNLMIYFAGHGNMNQITDKGYWVPYDADAAISDYVPNSTVMDIIYGYNIKHLMLICDCCFSGSFLSRPRSNSNIHYYKLFRSRSRWYFSSGRKETVDEGAPGIGSPFSVILCEFLEKNSESVFSFSELCSIVSKGVGTRNIQQPLSGPIVDHNHDDGEFVFNFHKENIQESIFNLTDPINKIVTSYTLAIRLKEKGFKQKSIFAYYRVNDEIVLKKFISLLNFQCAAFTYEEISLEIPDEIKVDNNTYLANLSGYERLGDLEKYSDDFAEITFQRTFAADTPYMAICKCRSRMVAFSKNEKGQYHNLITWGVNQADTAGEMWLLLFEEGKIVIKNS